MEKGIQTPMAQGRSTEIISMIKWIRTSRLSIQNSLSGQVVSDDRLSLMHSEELESTTAAEKMSRLTHNAQSGRLTHNPRIQVVSDDRRSLMHSEELLAPL